MNPFELVCAVLGAIAVVCCLAAYEMDAIAREQLAHADEQEHPPRPE